MTHCAQQWLVKSKLTHQVCCDVKFTGKTSWSADDNHLGQNDHQIKLHMLEEPRLAVVNESRFLFPFCEKTVMTKNPFPNIVKKHVWPYCQSRRKNSYTLFRQSESRIYQVFIACAQYLSQLLHAILHLLHALHAILHLSHPLHGTNAIPHLPH